MRKNYYNKKRWRMKIRARKHINAIEKNEWYLPNAQIKQDELTKKIEQFINMNDHDGKLPIHMGHYHICFYEMISNDIRWQNAQCREWCEKHNTKVMKLLGTPEHYGRWNETCICDYCENMIYIATDDEDKLIYATRTNQEETLKIYKEVLEDRKNEKNNSIISIS